MNPILSRTLWVTLPFLGLVTGMKDGLLYGAFGAGIFFAAILLFLALQPFAPVQFHRLLFYLILLTAGVTVLRLLLPQAGVFGLFLPASLCLLAPPELFRKRKNPLKILERNLWAGSAFWALVAGHGILSEWIRRTGIQLFPTPAGSYALLSLAATLLPRKVRK